MLKFQSILFVVLTLTCLSVGKESLFNNWNVTAIREKLCDKNLPDTKINELEKCAMMNPKEVCHSVF